MRFLKEIDDGRGQEEFSPTPPPARTAEDLRLRRQEISMRSGCIAGAGLEFEEREVLVACTLQARQEEDEKKMRSALTRENSKFTSNQDIAARLARLEADEANWNSVPASSSDNMKSQPSSSGGIGLMSMIKKSFRLGPADNPLEHKAEEQPPASPSHPLSLKILTTNIRKSFRMGPSQVGSSQVGSSHVGETPSSLSRSPSSKMWGGFGTSSKRWDYSAIEPSWLSRTADLVSRMLGRKDYEEEAASEGLGRAPSLHRQKTGTRQPQQLPVSREPSTVNNRTIRSQFSIKASNDPTPVPRESSRSSGVPSRPTPEESKLVVARGSKSESRLGGGKRDSRPMNEDQAARHPSGLFTRSSSKVFSSAGAPPRGLNSNDMVAQDAQDDEDFDEDDPIGLLKGFKGRLIGSVPHSPDPRRSGATSSSTPNPQSMAPKPPMSPSPNAYHRRNFEGQTASNRSDLSGVVSAPPGFYSEKNTHSYNLPMGSIQAQSPALAQITRQEQQSSLQSSSPKQSSQRGNQGGNWRDALKGSKSRSSPKVDIGEL